MLKEKPHDDVRGGVQESEFTHFHVNWISSSTIVEAEKLFLLISGRVRARRCEIMVALVLLQKVINDISVQDDPQQDERAYPPTKHFTCYTVLIA